MPAHHLPSSTLSILAVLFLMAILIRKGLPIPAVLAAALAGILLLFRVPPGTYLRALADPAGGFLRRVLVLVPMVYLINLLGMLMRRTGRDEELVAGLEGLLAHRGLMAAASASAMGLLPMPGGALLSADMVAMTLPEEKPAFKAALNLWFRHIWEMISPLYPGIIISSQLFGLPMGDLAAWNFSVFSAYILAGLLLLLGPVPPAASRPGTDRRHAPRRLLAALAPVLLAMALTLAGRLDLPAGWARLTGPLPGVGAGVLAAVLMWRPGWRRLGRAMLEAVDAGAQGILLLALMMATAVETSGAVEGLRSELALYHLPVPLTVALLPFLTGFLTGLTVGFVGMTMPLVAGLAGAWNTGMLFTLAYIAGFLGVLYSPVHLCVVLSARKFGAGYGGIYRRLIPPGLVVAAVLALLSVKRALWL